ncbi:MAG: hypothetical protein INR73_01510 [Williamsia sp.]|nr:hypothetical protein [Williamsia sp.]
MEEPFTLPVSYKGKEQDYEAQLELRGYTYRIRVTVEGQDVYYERDEEGAFRAIIPTDAPSKETRIPEAGLLQAIAQKIKAVLA